jgi:hypothetical protein
MTETVRSRFQKVMKGEMPEDRLPVLEWAVWWDKTIERWLAEGLPGGLDTHGIKRFFGLDVDYQHWFLQIRPGAPGGPVRHGQGWIRSEEDYERLLPYLYPDPVPFDRETARRWAAEQARGEVVVWFTLSGFFWWPRVLFGIEEHLYAFYDHPELMLRINEDQARYIRQCIEQFCEVCTPDFATFAEDMSYNHGPMISRELFETFMLPFYRQTVPLLKERGIIPLIDSDGDVEPLIPWMEEAGLEGTHPLERMAGVDVGRIRERHPEWKMLGGFDKTVMHLGEQAMRAEFERLLPVMKSGRYIPSVDHQTPPGVSLEDYRLYVRLLKEYCARAVQP